MGAIQAIRGTRDILPGESGYWQYLEKIAQNILSQAGYQEIRTPIFEQTALFERGIGEGTDVVGKEMYSFTDRGERPVTLRPEGTAGVARAYIERGLQSQGGPQRLWYQGPMFRYERPQAGRQRQFHQIGLELLGSPDPRADGEAIALATAILQALGLTRLTLALNSVGDGEDRQAYRRALVDYLTPRRDSLDPDSQARLARNPLRILDSKDPKTQEVVREAPSILDYLSPESRRHFEGVQTLLTDLGIDYQITPGLVRGLDYYTHTAFEIQSADLGAQATVCGGGRYDGLIGALGGPSTPAVGWAMGIERLILLLQQSLPAPVQGPDFYLASRGAAAERLAFSLAQKLRRENFRVELDLSGSAFSKQLKRADARGAAVCLIVGEEEAAAETARLKWLATQSQESLKLSAFWSQLEEIRRRLEEAKKN
ncbi:MAG: histidine--tRNA ligase [Cyanobacteria bacterium RI_101]|nr:histidine--tRNA ligase [Cyanobacteria bacterium RI_101]